MTLRNLIAVTAERVSALYSPGEARAIARELVCHVTGMSYTSLLVTGDEEPTAEERSRTEAMTERLMRGEPLQYVTGTAWFCGRGFAVSPDVLIPRPETEELVAWILSAEPGRKGSRRILDIGTGSGCIAVSLALGMEGAQTDAMDISAAALGMAEGNARALGAEIKTIHQDILAAKMPESPLYDIIVSNPPYVMESEMGAMERNVLDYEPHTALFVPDDDPLRFYRAIAEYARHALTEGGSLYFEINGMLGAETTALMESAGFARTELRRDMEGKPRMLRAEKRGEKRGFRK